ncbi:MAG: TlyA family rRNA (cytidine-2'-O)-methyltransferase [Coriobacteriaceae bacterium]|nr:TlyA family rRNA (cytidine-2'-O)-methyltransferase [Coriobacteriaceae bacterium]
MSRVRADVALVARGLFASREQARAAILAGAVGIAGRPVTKAGEAVAEDAEFEVAAARAFVSRGGTKLAGALDAFGIDPSGLRCIDVGASTGGFTDCLLQRGAASVAAVDVGYGQLDWKLRNDPRVAVFERTNIRYAAAEVLGAPFDLAVVDVSFIGLAKVLPHVLPMLAVSGSLVALVKPQFEAGRGRVGKKGVVRDPAVHAEVLASVCAEVEASGWTVTGLAWSPITGPEGNIEFWVAAGRHGVPTEMTPEVVVEAAHRALGG